MYKRIMVLLMITLMITYIFGCSSKNIIKTDKIKTNKVTNDLDEELKNYNYVNPEGNQKSRIRNN